VVSGAERVWLARRGVFVCNHRSKLDPIVIMKLLRGGFTGAAKEEAANGGCRKGDVTWVFAGRYT
jgi:putative phosphoserine phosphatase / 1-acylglycerol-3-phosphate O-acyltransferase